MAEWIVDIQSMIPMGQIGERMIVASREAMSDTCAVMLTPTLKTIAPNECIGNDGVFMTSNATSMFKHNEINQFLQAMMDAGWKRGIRPKDFDPSAGELAAVNRHLEDLRRVALMRLDIPVAISPRGLSGLSNNTNRGQEAAAQRNSDIGTDPDKSW